jgi:conjugal transfer pilus assembly protein TraK
MTPFFAYGLMAGGAAVASRLCLVSRGLGAGMIVIGAVALAAPAWADERVLAKDNSEVACTVSKSGLTRVSLKDDRFASVSKLSRSRVSFFGTTAKGYVYKFACRLGADDAQQVFVENKDIVGENGPEVAQVAATPQEASASLVQAMYQSASLDGFDILPSRMDAVMIGTLKVQMISEYRGASLAGRVLKIENKGREPVSLGEGTIAPSNAIAVSVANPQLKPGEATTAYIVTPAGLANGARP